MRALTFSRLERLARSAAAARHHGGARAMGLNFADIYRRQGPYHWNAEPAGNQAASMLAAGPKVVSPVINEDQKKRRAKARRSRGTN